MDGLNLYYGLFKNRKNKYSEEYKWLNLEKLVRAIFPSWGECKIMYFTSRVGKNTTEIISEKHLTEAKFNDVLETKDGRKLTNPWQQRKA